MALARAIGRGLTLHAAFRQRLQGLCERLGLCLIADGTSLSAAEIGRSAGAAFVAVFTVSWVTHHIAHGGVGVVMVASIGASSVLLFAAPHSPLSQPWPLLGGYLLSATIGVASAQAIATPWLAGAAAVAAAIAVMLYTHSLHPPAAAVALLAVVGGDAIRAEKFTYVIDPVGVNALLLLAAALVINNLLPGHRYPARRVPKKDVIRRHDDPPPLGRLGLSKDDLMAALRESDVYLDVSAADLGEIVERASRHALQRRAGPIRCADVMSRDIVSARADTDLEEIWARLRYHRIQAIPVLDARGHVMGMVTLVDFLKRVDLTAYANFPQRLMRFVRGANRNMATPRVARDIMSAPVKTVSVDGTLAELVTLLSDGGLHHLPVVDADGRLVGMVTQSDLIAALAHACMTGSQPG